MATTQTELSIGRAKNLVQEYLIRKLMFPKVFLDAEFNGKHVDVLAVNNSGTGDVHAVYIIYAGNDPAGAIETAIANLRTPAPARVIPHFVYSAVINEGLRFGPYIPSDQLLRNSFAEDGVGRVGLLYVDLAGQETGVRPIIKPERFRSTKEIVELTDKFVASHVANWEFRD